MLVGTEKGVLNSDPDVIQQASDVDTNLASEQTLCHKESSPQGNVLNIDPLGNAGDDRDPHSLFGRMDVHFSSPSGASVDVRVSPSLVYERKNRRIRTMLHQLNSSINYGGKRGRREGGSLVRNEMS